MDARADPTLTQEQLRSFADAIGAAKREQFARWAASLGGRGYDRCGDYEDHRDVAISVMEAARDGRAIFNEEKIYAFADQAGISRDAAAAQMPVFQRALALGTAAYIIDIAKGLRPKPSPRPRWRDLFWRVEIDAADMRFDTLSDMFLAGTDAFERGMVPSHTDGGSAPRDPVHVSDHVSIEEQSTREAQGASPEGGRLQSAGDPSTLGAFGSDAGAARELDRVDPDIVPDRDDGAPLAPACAPQPTSQAASEYVAGALATSTTTLQARDPDHEAVIATAPSLEQKRPSSETLTTNLYGDEWDGRLSTVWPTIVETKITIGEWKVSRRPELAGTLRIFTRLLGDISILTMTRDQASRLRERYLKLPKDHKNLWFDHEKGCDRTYDELIAHVAKIEADQGDKVRRVTSKTWNKQKGTLSAAIQWLKANRETAKAIDNPFDGLHVRTGKTVQAIRLERSMATTASLEALFRSEYWTGRRDDYHLFGKGSVIVRDSLYWVPLFEVCLGLRREEACQLRGRHFRRKFNHLGIDLFAEDIDVKVGDGASRRWVPLSKAMLDLGVVEDLVLKRGPDDLLFPELSNDNAHGKYGVSFGKRFLRYVQLVNVDFREAAEALCSDPSLSPETEAVLIGQELDRLHREFRCKTNNHAFRHWFKTLAENSGCKTMFLRRSWGTPIHREQAKAVAT